MKIIVDWELCEGHGQCEFAASEVFTVEDDGSLTVLNEDPPESERHAVELAVRRCPTRALVIQEHATKTHEHG